MHRHLLAAAVALPLLAAPAQADTPIRVSATPASHTVDRGGRLVVTVRVRGAEQLVLGDVTVRLRRDGAPTLRRSVAVLPDDTGRWAHRIGIRIPVHAPAGRYRVTTEMLDEDGTQLATSSDGTVRVGAS